MKTDTDFSRNKRCPDGIVYRDANGELTVLRPEDFRNANEFQKWKSLSDAEYHCEENGDHRERNHITGSLNEHCVFLSFPDTRPNAARTDEEARLRILRAKIRRILTDKQYRRFWAHCVDGKSVTAISREEHIPVSSICDSIRAAKRRLARELFEDRSAPDRNEEARRAG